MTLPRNLALTVTFVGALLSSCSPQKTDTIQGTTVNRPDVTVLTKDTSIDLLRGLVGKWKAVENSFSADQNSIAMMECVMAADGNGISTVYTQGSGDSYYEATALWGFSDTGNEIRVFEVNNAGVAEMHVGLFRADSSLRLELHDAKSNDLLQKRNIRWKNDTLTMSATFIVNGKPSDNTLVLVRQAGGSKQLQPQ